MLEELDKLINHYNKAAKAMLDYVSEHDNDPFFETENGQDVLKHMGGIAMESGMLNMKMVLIKLQNLVIDMENAKE